MSGDQEPVGLARVALYSRLASLVCSWLTFLVCLGYTVVHGPLPQKQAEEASITVVMALGFGLAFTLAVTSAVFQVMDYVDRRVNGKGDRDG